MRKKLATLLLGISALLPFTSCVKDEPLNAECDIEQVTLHCSNPGLVFYNLTDTTKQVLYTDSVISFNVRRNASMTGIKPEFKITPGATIAATGGGLESITSNRTGYRVTSQDGNWHRDYTIVLNPVTLTESDTIDFDFEHYELEPKAQKYYIWHNVLSDGTLGNNWATGNPGFQISMSSAKPVDYPTVPCENGHDGAGVKLTTRDTGPFGALVNKRLAAGNLFLGEFDVSSALRDAMKATRFGIPFNMKPVKITGYYKYRPGEKYQDKLGKEIVGKRDSADVYAVFYDNHDADGNSVILHGDDVKTNSHIVAIAQLASINYTDDWTAFEATFVYNKEIDMTKLENMGYNLTVVFSSSKGGASFQGAVDSQLSIDHVRLICTKEK